MTSRRPMTRSYSGNGRSSSFSEEEGSSSNGRNTYLSNVRPENSYSRFSHYRPTRSTLCTVMAQLTEDVQPSFETTLKSKAVSENCNVKFTCVVSGYPAPELKWYKDDMEMDRYCGLPKYEIRRNGKTHTLHIYNCTLDDAAIYQVSATNSKGIVSCSGVLEVGTMSEYQIHQRFFAKLKAKAEKKRQDLEDSTKKVDTAEKGPVQNETEQKTPERTPRKRPIPQPKHGPEEPLVGAADMDSQNAAKEPVPASPVTPGVKTDNENALAKKKIKISNGMDAQTDQPSTPKGANVRNDATSNGSDNHYDGGMGLAQFLAETLQSQTTEEKQVTNKEETAETNKNELAHEEDSKQKMEDEMEMETSQLQERSDQEMKEESRENTHPTPPPSRHHGRGPKEQKDHKEHKDHKDHKDHHIPASISSMLHSKDVHESKSRDIPDSPNIPHKTPPSFFLQSENKSETKHKDDSGMSMEDAQLQESTLERSKVTEEQEDMCKTEISVESPGHDTVGGSADQAMEVTAEEPPLSSPKLLIEVSNVTVTSEIAALPVSVTSPVLERAEPRDMTDQEETTETENREVTDLRDTTEHRETSAVEQRDTLAHTETTQHRETSAAEPRDTLAHIETAQLGEMPETEQMVGTIEFIETPKHKEMYENGKALENIETMAQKAIVVTEDREAEAASQEEHKSESDKQAQGELAEQNVAENKLTVTYETPKTDVNILALSKTVEASIESEINQSLKEARIESFMSVERLSFKPPLYPSLSPASLRKFMSKSDKAEDSLSGGSTPTSSLSCESSPRLKRRDSLSLIRSATPEELASGARRKIYIPKTKEDTEDNTNKKDAPYMSPGQAPPQVIRKIRGEPFPDASGHLKLWCQFFNVLSDSIIKWYKEEQEILEIHKSGGDETQVALAIVLASNLDCGVYGCTIKNEYGSDTTDFLLSEDVMAEILLKGRLGSGRGD
ncbi:hypothetical protein WMY93_023532 [Mugilogobius chulae]|uniref:non-specific serine/threonine protein kinase n=1 Tax=Mugilogobius chulae TaxID=88201 RepID=A0AAW0N4I1_9GOBI